MNWGLQTSQTDQKDFIGCNRETIVYFHLTRKAYINMPRGIALTIREKKTEIDIYRKMKWSNRSQNQTVVKCM